MRDRVRHGVAAVLVGATVAACGGGASSGRPSMAPSAPGSPAVSPPPMAATTRPGITVLLPAIFPFAGAYRTPEGGTVVVTQQGWLVDLRTGSVLTLSPLPGVGAFATGAGFAASPPQGTTRFTTGAAGTASGLVEQSPGGGTVAAARVVLQRREVRIRSGDATLAGTIVEPPGPGPRPGIVITHGAGTQVRQDADLFTILFAGLGFSVLTYDKRGVGDSGGTYPGERATESNLQQYAADLVAVMQYLQTAPGVDRTRVGVYGGSQAGWVIPLAAAQLPSFGFAVVAVGPAVTVTQQERYAAFSGDGAFVPPDADVVVDAAVRATSGGFDPAPALRRLTAPVLWLLGGNDRHVPTRVSAANLASLGRPNITVTVVPGADHALLDTPNGLDSEDATASRFAPAVFDAITAWARHAGLVT